MRETIDLMPARVLAQRNEMKFPNESIEYRSSRNLLLAEEIELRRHIERVAQMRRSLPAGGRVGKNYKFTGESGQILFSDLFGDKETLIVYSMMYGPDRALPCPMCTALLTSWNGTIRNLQERAAVVVTARSPFSRLRKFVQERDLRNLTLLSDETGDFTRDYVSPTDADTAGLSVFSRRSSEPRHFWSMEMTDAMADPGQDQRGAPDADLLWTILDLTPEGRGSDWYPQLQYGNANRVVVK